MAKTIYCLLNPEKMSAITKCPICQGPLYKPTHIKDTGKYCIRCSVQYTSAEDEVIIRNNHRNSNAICNYDKTLEKIRIRMEKQNLKKQIECLVYQKKHLKNKSLKYGIKTDNRSDTCVKCNSPRWGNTLYCWDHYKEIKQS